MRSVNDGRLTRWTLAVAGAATSVVVACSGGAGASPDGDVSVGDEGLSGLSAFDGASAAKGPGTEALDVPSSGDGFSEADNGGTDSVAYVDVEHTRTPDIEFSQAMAHVARGASPARVTVTARLVGLSVEIPNPGQCIAPSSKPRPSLSGLSELSLLDAGAITIHASPLALPVTAPRPEIPVVDSSVGDDAALGDDAADERQAPPMPRTPVVVSLAPRAFPSVSSLASGVVYTSRDRVTRLPDVALYQVEVAGGRETGPLTLIGEAPAYLRNVTLSGLPIDQVQTLDRNAPIDVTWDVGAAGDVVFVELIDRVDGSVALRCSFADAAGSGTVPWEEELVAGGVPEQARISVHRFRRVATHRTAAVRSRGELRFDFELSQDVHFD